MKFFLIVVMISFLDINYQKSKNDIVNTEKNTSLDMFVFPIEDVFFISEKGVVVTGEVESGEVSIGDTLDIVDFSNQVKSTVVTGIEKFRKKISKAKKGDKVGLFLSDVVKDSLERGMVLSTPNTLKPAKNFDAKILILKKNVEDTEAPFYNDFKPFFSIRTKDVLGEINLKEGQPSIIPGDSTMVNIKLDTFIALDTGVIFKIKEGGRTIGNGRVIHVLN